ncbi:MAG: methylaspartate mutase subunit E [Deltaproteobacteria bacterium]|nr:MAG: methylaspartate mutase subunit E [Deltaproteobacteria bacterium]
MDLKNKMLSEDEFFEERQEVLAQWPTGKDVDLDEAIAFHKSLPLHKVWTHKLKQAKEHDEFYAITGMGMATVEQQLELLTYIEKEGKADLLGTSVDSFSRQNDYEEAERGIHESVKKGRSILNGFPIVNHGVAGFRRIIQAVDSPISMRYGAADTRLIDEIGYAGGHTAGAADALMDFWHHHSRIPLETVISTHRYVQRLIGYYEAHGVPICASCQGLYGAGIPPGLQMAAILVQIVMMAEQGVKHIRFHISAHGNLAQDVATANVLRKLAQEYLNRHGYHDIEDFLSVSFSLVQYPLEPGAAFAVAFMNTLMTKLCGAQANDIRTVAEAKGIPTKEDTAYTFRTVRVMENLLKTQKITMDHNALEVEARIGEQEARSIVDKVLEFGDGDVVEGTIRAVKAGVLDNPFATNRTSPCKVMGIKDAEGAIRYLNHGNLPFTKDILEFHKGKIMERENKKGEKLDYDTLVSDLLAISKGVLVE